MDILNEVFGGTSGAALFGANVEPSRDEIEAACRDAKVYGDAINTLIERVGLRKGMYADQQPLFGPLLRMMTLAGWTYSGSGFFSVAFFKGGLCVKVSLRGTSDSAFDYLHWAKDHQGQPGVPTVYAIGEFSHAGVAVLERYECARAFLKNSSEAFNDHLEAEFIDVQQALEDGTLPDFPIGLTALCIREAFPDGRFDMHHGNVMLDRNGGMVITDPLGKSRDNPTCYGGYSYTYSPETDYRQAA